MMFSKVKSRHPSALQCERCQATIGTSDDTLEWVSFPLGCIKAVNQAEEDPLAITILAKVMLLDGGALFPVA